MTGEIWCFTFAEHGGLQLQTFRDSFISISVKITSHYKVTASVSGKYAGLWGLEFALAQTVSEIKKAHDHMEMDKKKTKKKCSRQK